MSGSWLRDWWWVLCFCVAVLSVYFSQVQIKDEKLFNLVKRYDALKQEKSFAVLERENLRQQIDSQNDPSWIEMILMRDLGVVPEGWLKVHFTK